MKHVTPRSTSANASNFIFTVAMKVLVKPPVFASRSPVPSETYRYCMDAAAQYSTMV